MGHICFSKCRVEPLKQGGVMPVEEVPVAIKGRADGSVAEPLLYLLGIPTLVDEDCRAGMPEVMEANPLRQPCFSRGRLEMTLAEIVLTYRPALGSREHVAIARRVASDVLSRLIQVNPSGTERRVSGRAST